MKKLTILITFAMMTFSSLQAAEKLTLKDITSGVFSASYVTGINPLAGTDRYASISHDGKKIEAYSFKTGARVSVLFDADKAGASFDRIDGYVLSPDSRRMLIVTNRKAIYRRSFTADYYVYDVRSNALVSLSAGGPQQVATWSPDSRHIAFVRANNLFVTDADKLLAAKKDSGQSDASAEKQVTTDGKWNEVINGIPDWVNEEEFSFNRAFAWNADGSSLSWIRYDESRVKTYSLQLFQGLSPKKEEFADYPGSYSYKYPKAGQDNAQISLWSYDLQTGKTLAMQVPLDADGYIPRIKATPDAHTMIAFTMNRHQSQLVLYAFDPSTGKAQKLIGEQDAKYVKEEVVEWASVGKKYILLPSERNGQMHLYLYDLKGNLLRQVDKGDYVVTDVYGIDEQKGDVYFQCTLLGAHDRQVCVAHANGTVERISQQKGNNSAVFSGDYRYFVNTWNCYDHPSVYTLFTNKGKKVRVLEDNAALVEKTQQYNWGKREPFSFTTSEGVKLDGWMVKPLDFDASRHYPVILYQYSGPGNQQVLDSWNSGGMGQGGAFDYYLAQEGFIVVCVDGRGTGGRGADFEKCTYLKLGDLEAKDQVETALYVGSLPYVDKDHIGIWGWSFGGFCTLMSMSEGRPVFYAGVAVAPPTSWRYYDTVYTERYMRTPQENAEGYKTNPIERADSLHGHLLICHGMADDNVHPQNTFEYAEALVQADKDFREIYYTNRNHSIYGGNSRNHLLRQIVDWFKLYLK